MKANTALCFILAGTALLLRDWKVGRLFWPERSAAIGVLTLVEYVAGVNLGIDQLFFREVVRRQTRIPGGWRRRRRSVSCSFAGAVDDQNQDESSPADGPDALPGGGNARTIAVVGYVYKDPGFYGFYGFGGASNVALPTAIAFMVLAAGLIFARTDGLAGVPDGSSSRRNSRDGSCGGVAGSALLGRCEMNYEKAFREEVGSFLGDSRGRVCHMPSSARDYTLTD